jgi:hypothetical protein
MGQPITVQLTHHLAYFAHHTRVGWRERERDSLRIEANTGT